MDKLYNKYKIMRQDLQKIKSPRFTLKTHFLTVLKVGSPCKCPIALKLVVQFSGELRSNI